MVLIRVRHPSRSGHPKDDAETVLDADHRITTVGELMPEILATNPDLIQRAENYVLEQLSMMAVCWFIRMKLIPKPEDGKKELKINMHLKFTSYGAKLTLDQKTRRPDGVYEAPDDQNLVVDTSYRVSKLKRIIYKKTGVTPNQLSLSTMGATMEDWLPLSTYIIDLDSQNVHLHKLLENATWTEKDFDADEEDDD